MIFPSPKVPRPSLNPAHFLLGYLMESFFFLRDSSPPVQDSIAAHRSPTFRPAALHKQIRYRIRISHSDPFFSSHFPSGRLFWLMVWALSWYHVLCQEEKNKTVNGFPAVCSVTDDPVWVLCSPNMVILGRIGWWRKPEKRQKETTWLKHIV